MEDNKLEQILNLLKQVDARIFRLEAEIHTLQKSSSDRLFSEIGTAPYSKTGPTTKLGNKHTLRSDIESEIAMAREKALSKIPRK